MTTKLRLEMDNAMVLRGFALRTREAYLACVTALARHYHRSPDGLDTVEIQGYLLHLIKEKKLAYASVNQAVCSFRFLFDAVLGHKTLALEIPMAKVPKRLPQVLSREEVSRLFAATASLRARTVLMTTYAAGLRVSEICALQVTDIESAPTACASRCVRARAARRSRLTHDANPRVVRLDAYRRPPLCFILRSGAYARYDSARAYPPKREPAHARARAQHTFKIDSCLVSRCAGIRPRHLAPASRLTSRLPTLQSP